MKLFRVVVSTSRILTLTVASASIIGILITGFYFGIIVLVLLTVIPMASIFFAKKVNNYSSVFQRNYYRIATFMNVLNIFIVLWMTFVILVDRVFGCILEY